MLPEFLKPFFWSSKFEKLDKEKDKNLIIFNILNFGDYDAWQWLFKHYRKEEIRETVINSTATAWRKPSLYLWQAVLDAKAKPYRFSNMPVPADLWPY